MADRSNLPFRILVWISIVALVAAFLRFALPYLMIIVFVLLFGGNKTKQLEQVESPDHMTKAILVETTPSLSIDSRGLDVYVSRIGVRERERKPIMEGGGFEDLK